MDQSKSPWTELWDAPWFGVGVGIVIGAIGSLVSAKWVVGVGGAIITIEIFRHDFVGKGIVWRLLFNVFLACALTLALISGWKYIPKPPEPLTRSDVAEILGQHQPRVEKDVSGDKPLTKKELAELLSQYRPGYQATAAPCANYTIAEVSDELKSDGRFLSEIADEWRGDDNNQFMVMTDSVRAHGSAEELKEADQQWAKRKKEIAVSWLKKSMATIVRANGCRQQIINNRIPTLQGMEMVDQGNKVFAKLLQSDGDSTPDDMQRAQKDLEFLRQEISSLSQ